MEVGGRPIDPLGYALPSHSAARPYSTAPLSALSARSELGARRELFAAPRPVLPFSSPAPRAAVSAAPLTPPPIAEKRADSEPAHFRGQVYQDMKNVPHPEKFTGTDRERVGSREWLQSANVYMRLTASTRTPQDQVDLFGLLFEGAAKTWFWTNQEREGAGWTLDRAFEVFLQTYTGGLTRSMLEAEMASLRLGGENTKDIAAFNARFDMLASQLYPGSWNNDTASIILGDKYAGIIKDCNFALWEEAMHHKRKPQDGREFGLADWKEAMQDAIVVLAGVRRGGSRFGRYTTKSDNGGVYSTQTGSSTAKANKMQTSEVSEEGETWQRREGEKEGENEEAARMQAVSKGKRGGGGAKTESGGQQKGRQLTDEERSQLMAKGACFRCYKTGHLSRDCPDKGKPRRVPTQEDLKA
jgi:Zinc knuckle